MQQVLNSLLDLQDLDEQLGELDRSKVYLPEMIDNINSEITNLEKDLHENQEKLIEAQKRQKQLELDIETDKAELEKYQKQMKVIKTNKEYDALVTEIDSKKQTINDNEDEVLKLMGVVDESTEKIEELKQKLEEVKANNQAHLDNLRSELLSLESKISEKKQLRKELAKTIDRKALTVYERIRKGKKGMAVVPLRKRACGGCFKQIPPHLVQQIRRGDRIYTCDSCGRILIWSNEE
jgi:predicted  nucleic acid-binding Zn-ribbon protein